MDMIEEKSRVLRPGQQAVTLFTTGPMSPPHLGHVRRLEVAAQYFAAQRFGILATLLSPSDERWSRHKACGCLKNADKLSLCHLVETELVKVDDWEISQRSLMDFPDVRRHLVETVHQRLGESANIQIFYVCGADHAANCGLFELDWCVVLRRDGEACPDKCRAIVLDNHESNESSTAIRKAIQENQIETVRHMLHPAVYDKLATSKADKMSRTS